MRGDAGRWIDYARVIEKLKAGDRLQQDTPTSLSNRTMPVRSLSGVEVSYFLSFDQHRSTAVTISKHV
jgi:hypothetical protein